MAMATYARQTGSFVIAEGIEDQETLDFLSEIDEQDLRPDRIIQGGQGYGLGRPGPQLESEPPRLLPGAVIHLRVETPAPPDGDHPLPAGLVRARGD